ncbi:MAG: D-Ala-D-Ala carboxypeptidase family metallohydrolase [Ramlibacter sp.]
MAAAAADDTRDLAMFRAWLPAHRAQVQAFEAFLAREQLTGVVPTWQLLRSASMWRECKAPPFALPPPAQWREAARVLALLKELRRTGVLGPFAVMSAYRGPALNRCAGGAGRSSHLKFAVDFVPLAPWDDQKLCAFWREQGRRWDMGLSRYPSGRIHIDRTGWRSWGADHTGTSSFCRQRAEPRR